MKKYLVAIFFVCVFLFGVKDSAHALSLNGEGGLSVSQAGVGFYAGASAMQDFLPFLALQVRYLYTADTNLLTSAAVTNSVDMMAIFKGTFGVFQPYFGVGGGYYNVEAYNLVENLITGNQDRWGYLNLAGLVSQAGFNIVFEYVSFGLNLRYNFLDTATANSVKFGGHQFSFGATLTFNIPNTNF